MTPPPCRTDSQGPGIHCSRVYVWWSEGAGHCQFNHQSATASPGRWPSPEQPGLGPTKVNFSPAAPTAPH